MNTHRLTLITLAALTILCAGCGTLAPATQHGVINTPPLTVLTDAVHAVHPPSAADASPLAAEVRPIDPLARALTSPSFVDHANKALALAGDNDPIFTQCVQFGLTLGAELVAKPLVSAPQLSLVTADPSCPLCVLEAKRRDLAAVESGALAAQIAQVRVRVRSIRTRLALACGPLYMDELDVAGRAAALFGGLL